MIRLSPGIALVFAWTWGCSGGADIPPVEIGGPSGARLMNGQAKSPAEAYENAYARLTRAHYDVHRNLDARGQNQLGASEAMAQIIRCLEMMRVCVPIADRDPFDPYIVRYTGWEKDIEKGTWGGAFLTDLERTEREVKSKFNPGSVRCLPQFTDAVRIEPVPVKNPEPTFTADKVEVPVLKKTEGPEAPKEFSSDLPVVNPAATLKLLYKAWDRAHDELVAAYKEKKDCKPKYEDAVAALKLLKDQHHGEQAKSLELYLNYYADISEKTRTFSALPEKTTEKDILDELDVAARVIRKRFNPDK
ncbi:MAG TPA: hypothetical protein VKU80_12240 [Planctomycetota bacterium]|nr:hypothetical protein [Planctomycetota bacterium]